MIKVRKKGNIILRVLKWIGGSISAIIGAIFVALSSWLYAGFVGYVIGLVIQFLFGTWVSQGLCVIFDTTRFTSEMIPYMSVVLSLFVNFFKGKPFNLSFRLPYVGD